LQRKTLHINYLGRIDYQVTWKQAIALTNV